MPRVDLNRQVQSVLDKRNMGQQLGPCTPARIPLGDRFPTPALGCRLNRSRDCTRSRVPMLRVGALC